MVDWVASGAQLTAPSILPRSGLCFLVVDMACAMRRLSSQRWQAARLPVLLHKTHEVPVETMKNFGVWAQQFQRCTVHDDSIGNDDMLQARGYAYKYK